MKETHSIQTDRGSLRFRIDSPGSVPQDPNSERSEPETFEWIREYLKEGQTLWDVGANIGVFSIYAAIEKKNNVLSQSHPLNLMPLLMQIYVQWSG